MGRGGVGRWRGGQAGKLASPSGSLGSARISAWESVPKSTLAGQTDGRTRTETDQVTRTVRTLALVPEDLVCGLRCEGGICVSGEKMETGVPVSSRGPGSLRSSVLTDEPEGEPGTGWGGSPRSRDFLEA